MSFDRPRGNGAQVGAAIVSCLPVSRNKIRTSVLSTRVTVSLRIIFIRRIMYNVLFRLKLLRDGTDA